MMKYDALVYGPVFCDLIFTDLDNFPELGKEVFADNLTLSVGGSAIVATGLHRLGAKVGLIADIGNDAFSNLVMQQLEDLQLNLSLIQRHPFPSPQVSVALSYPHDRAFVTRFKQPDQRPNISAILAANSTQHLHVCSILGAFDMPEICEMAHCAGATISMDPGWDEVLLHDARLLDMITDLDIFFPSRNELCAIAGTEDVDSAAWKVLAGMDHGWIIVKQGSEGARAYLPGKASAIHTPALVVEAVDTTGAGDAFDAGFLRSYLQGLPIETSMQYGVICGGLTTTAQGGVNAIPNKEELEQWLSKLPS